MTPVQLALPAQEPTEARVDFTVTIPDRIRVQPGEYACKHGWATVLVRLVGMVYEARCPRCEK